MSDAVQKNKSRGGEQITKIFSSRGGAARLKAWERAKGMWKKRTSDPIQEYKKMRAEWDR